MFITWQAEPGEVGEGAAAYLVTENDQSVGDLYFIWESFQIVYFYFNYLESFTKWKKIQTVYTMYCVCVFSGSILFDKHCSDITRPRCRTQFVLCSPVSVCRLMLLDNYFVFLSRKVAQLPASPFTCLTSWLTLSQVVFTFLLSWLTWQCLRLSLPARPLDWPCLRLSVPASPLDWHCLRLSLPDWPLAWHCLLYWLE